MRLQAPVSFEVVSTQVLYTGQHVLVPSQYLFVCNIGGLAIFIDNDTVRVHDSIGWDGRVRRWLLKGHMGSEFAVNGAWKVDTVY